ncbi:MAG: protein phosphatase CheZ [Gammaproteobacteria bacterium]|nr:protein phosphatase CheZ [Gammaproteobacteria bacterium]
MASSTHINKQNVKSLLEALEQGDETRAEALLDELTQVRESELFQQVSSLTHNLHQTLEGLGDAEILLQTKHDIPDATERLEYVMTATEEASNKTLESSERALAALSQLEMLMSPLVAEEDKALLSECTATLNSELTNIMLAQSFQDLTGQVLNRVILVISSLEQSLIALIHESGHDYDAIPERAQTDEQKKADQMKGVGPNVTDKSKEDLAETQEDVDDLLAGLGL